MKVRLWSKFVRQLYVLRRERSGLLTLLCCLLFYFLWMDHSATEVHVPEASEQLIARYLYNNEPARNGKERTGFETVPLSSHREEAHFVFSPNTVTEEELVLLGLSPKQAQSFIRYRELRGGFRSTADLEKIYVLPDGWLDRHRNSMDFPPAPEQATVREPYPGETKPASHPPKNDWVNAEPSTIVDINAVDSLELISIRGIGPQSAGRILAYRDRLGGFHSVEQYEEIWGLHPEVRKVLYVTTAPLSGHRKIDLNTADTETLGEHPYIRFKLARSLVAMRGHRGKLDTNDLRSHHLIDDSLYQRIIPYLHVETP